jgi:dihydropteroate synthase
MEHIVFLTGRLAEPALRRVLGSLAPPADDAPFSWEVREIGVQVAALMTADLVRRRVPAPVAADRIILPGRCRGDVDALTSHYGVRVERGPEELKDLPRFFKRAALPVTLDDYEVAIFAEIVDAPRLAVDAIVARAQSLAADGANVIDLGGLPETAFPHLEDSVRALKALGLQVSVDSQSSDELLRGGRAGADYLLSLTLDTLWIADEVPSTPVLIPRTPQDEASLWQAIETMQARRGADGRPRAFLADAILDPLPFGLLASLVRYHRLRERFADVPIMVGVGNLTELTEADTSGINALLLGICAELRARAILTTQVSGHARRAVREADWARRIMHAARTLQTLPKGLSDALMTVHAKQPFPDTPDEIASTAQSVRDPNFRVQVSARGLHVYNRDGLREARDPFALWPQLGLEGDAGHAFYMGVELARAQIAWQLGKRYVQDQPLDWGCAYQVAADDKAAWCAPGSTRSGVGSGVGSGAGARSSASHSAGTVTHTPSASPNAEPAEPSP